MKDCLEFEGYHDETRNDRMKISFKANEIGLKQLPLGSRAYENPAQNSNQPRIGVSGNIHNVG